MHKVYAKGVSVSWYRQLHLLTVVDSMAVDEAKRIFQGGEQFIPTKHGIAKRMVFNSGIYITCNVVSYVK